MAVLLLLCVNDQFNKHQILSGTILTCLLSVRRFNASRSHKTAYCRVGKNGTTHYCSCTYLPASEEAPYLQSTEHVVPRYENIQFDRQRYANNSFTRHTFKKHDKILCGFNEQNSKHITRCRGQCQIPINLHAKK